MAAPRDFTLTIANGATLSAEQPMTVNGSRRRLSLLIGSPTTMPESITILVRRTIGGTAYTLQSGGADITLTAGKATPIYPISVASLQLKAGGAVGADRVFEIMGAADVQDRI
jgi:hypothetical protein